MILFLLHKLVKHLQFVRRILAVIKLILKWITLENMPKKGAIYIEMDRKILAKLYPSCDALGNPHDLNSPGSQQFLKP